MDKPQPAAADQTAAGPGEPSAKESHRPSLGGASFECPHCHRLAYQKWRDLRFSDRTPRLHERKSNPSVWQVSLCHGCKQPALWQLDRMVYPLAPLGSPPHPDMPGDVRALYEEAAAVAAVSRRAGAALARTTVERLMKHLDPNVPVKDNNLDRRIARIKERGVSTPLGKMLDVVRVTGNGALHVDDRPGELVVMALDDRDGPPLLELFLEVVNDLVDELIVKPRTTHQLWNKLPEKTKERLAPTGERDAGK
jgi:hypothetical protein